MQALQLFAPEEAAHLDDAVRFTPIRQEQLKDRLSDRFYELDIPLLLEWPDGRREALLFVIEQQTDPRQFSTHKLARYCLEIAELLATDRVVPVVIFLKSVRNRGNQLALGNEYFRYLQFRYIQAVLPEMPAEQHLESPNLVARLNLPNMRWPAELKLAIYASAIRGLRSLEQNPDKQIKYLEFVDIYTALDNNERQAFERRYPQEEDTMSSYIATALEKAAQKGMQEGIEKGIEKAMLEMANNLLAQGLLDDGQIASVSGLPLAQIQALRSQQQH
ncbi:MAG TPA: hypothetical protein PKE27_08435 [Povalibacter sp.]|uniref:hypothetical protein n=1 Tax=Povalibacter sp. TaxID=1962978 RepID=UPI002B7A8AA7|nr:hypothetical protein [Povalibacter sp.]HMN44584.1 hypothetical protein [Povalibacter sp.]